MCYIDPALIEELNLAGPAKQRLPPRLRAALIAACVCLALVGTGAAVIVNGWVKVFGIAFFPNTNVNGTKTSYAKVEIAYDGTVYIPFEQFSQEARDVPQSSTYLPQYRGFDSWDEAEEFLGIEIANNPVLDQIEPITRSIEDDRYGIKLDDVGCSVTFSGLMDSPAIRLETVYPFESDDSGISRLIVSAFIVTQPLGSDERLSNMTFHNSQMPVTETYVTPTGLQAVIVTAKQGFQPEFGTVCQTVFQLNGASFTLFTFYMGDDPSQIVNMMKEILDAYS